MTREQFRAEIYRIMCSPIERPIIRAIINKAGFTRLSDVTPEHYQSILDTFQKVKR